jgi:hypothetical protein
LLSWDWQDLAVFFARMPVNRYYVPWHNDCFFVAVLIEKRFIFCASINLISSGGKE